MIIKNIWHLKTNILIDGGEIVDTPRHNIYYKIQRNKNNGEKIFNAANYRKNPNKIMLLRIFNVEDSV